MREETMPKETSGTVLEKKSRDNRLGVAVALHRDGSGGHVVKRHGSYAWLNEMQFASKYNYAKVSVVLHPVICAGYDDEHGVSITIVPGNFDGIVGIEEESGKEIKSPFRPISDATELWNYGSKDGQSTNRGDLTITTNLRDAILLHRALGKVIANAKRMPNRFKKRHKAAA